MSCGTRIQGRFGGTFERDEMVEKLESEGEYRLASKVKHGDCLDSRELRHAEQALDAQGMSRHFDYREERCHCESDEEE